MKQLIKQALAVVAVFVLATVSLTWAIDFRAPSLIRGGTLKLYNGTGDTAVTWKQDDSYATNRTYVNDLGTTVTPLATNSTTGEIYASFAQPVEVWPLTTGAPATSINVTCVATANAAFTNTVTIYLQKSSEGTYFSTFADTNYFAFHLPGGDGVVNTGVLSGDVMVVSTNLSATFLQGARYVRIWKIVGGANPTDAGIITITSLKLGRWTP